MAEEMIVEHGTRLGYQVCVKRPEGSCEECRAARRAYNIERLAAGRVQHGTRAGYQCCVQRPEGACPPCRDAQRVYLAYYLTDRTIPIKHGTRAGYRRCLNQPGGACEPCRSAHNAYLRNWRAKQRQKRANAADTKREDAS